jgi:hypothetical protein
MTNRRVLWVGSVLILAAVAYLVSGCKSLPSVPDEVVKGVEGEGVTIIAEYNEPSSTNEWTVTDVVVEVVGPEPRLDVLAAALTAAGWELHEVPRSEDLLLAGEMPEGHISVFRLQDFLNFMDSGEEVDKFSRLERRPGSSYFVLSLSPF